MPVASLVIVATAVLVGAQSLSGAVLAGILATIIPELFRRWGVDSASPQMLFGVGAVQALSQGGGGISSTFPWRVPRRSTQPMPAAASTTLPLQPVGGETRPVLEVRELRVQYGALTALNDVGLLVPANTVVGVIGPNGAGKSTLIDAVTGFAASYRGEVLLGDRPIDALSATARAKAGLRRTFQQGRAIPELTVGQYVNLFLSAPLAAAEMDDLLGFFELPPADEPVQFVDVGTRRVLEVAACVASRPTVAFLDEPAAGLGRDQRHALGERIKVLPSRFGCSVVLVDHDVELVASVCAQITVLDFGIVVAAGAPETVLADKVVAAAYLGDDFHLDGPASVDGLS